jgi:holo-[acyl-carrier protein] synthase
VTILGHGIDLVSVARIAHMVEHHGDRFLERVFTEGERRYSEATRKRDERLAARFAAKEAVFKALGTGWAGVGWTSVEIVNLPSGEPTVRLHGQAADLADRLGVTSWRLSLTHTADHAAASAIACSAD